MKFDHYCDVQYRPIHLSFSYFNASKVSQIMNFFFLQLFYSSRIVYMSIKLLLCMSPERNFKEPLQVGARGSEINLLYFWTVLALLP